MKKHWERRQEEFGLREEIQWTKVHRGLGLYIWNINLNAFNLATQDYRTPFSKWNHSNVPLPSGSQTLGKPP